jgi:hypothetical protein
MSPRFEDDFMEFGESGLVPVREGWYDKKNNIFILEDGTIVDEDGELIYLDDEDENR